MSNTIITGGSGFLATEFLKKLKNKKNIYLISRKKLKINKNFKNIVCDLRNKSNTIKIFKKINPSTVYHFAWKGIPKFNKKNFLENKNISESLIQGLNNINCKRIIISGSGAEYGINKKFCYEESRPGKNITELGRQKNSIRKLFFNRINKKTAIIWARIFYVYGKNQREGSLLKKLFQAKKNRNFVFLKFPFIFNDYIYVKDVVNALAKLKKINKSQIINICSSKGISNYDFVKIFEKINKVKVLKIGSVQNIKKIQTGSNRKLKKLGWKQKYNLKKAFKELCHR